MARLLVVENDDTIGGVLESRVAGPMGTTCCGKLNGRGVLREETLAEFHLALLDLGLSELDGVEACRRLRRATGAPR